jgi:hypothetical protein
VPLVRLEVRQGRSATQKQALLDAAHAALVEASAKCEIVRFQMERGG